MPTHAERRFLPYTPAQMFALVAAVERYPEFLPWCVSARIRERSATHLVADLEIGYRLFRERFTSHVQIQEPGRIDVQYQDGPFRYLNNHWLFEPAKGGCVIDFYVDFEFRSRLLQGMMALVFNRAVQVMVSAFEARADSLYGKKNRRR